MNEEQKMLMRKLQEYEFACLDLQLFLDTHPNDQQALAEYNKYGKLMMETKKLYEDKYGLLTSYGTTTSNSPWEWVYQPWPWE